MRNDKLYLKRGRPTKYVKNNPNRVIIYINKCRLREEFPTIEQLASYLGVRTRVLYEWEKLYPDFLQTMDMLRDSQRHLLISGGLSNKYNARFASFLLKANHGMSDTKPMVNATQNNIFNGISPELLAEVLELTRNKEIANK